MAVTSDYRHGNIMQWILLDLPNLLLFFFSVNSLVRIARISTDAFFQAKSSSEFTLCEL